MGKTILMVIGLTVVCTAGTACFGVFGPPKETPAGTTVEDCAGLSGDAKAECERQHAE